MKIQRGTSLERWEDRHDDLDRHECMTGVLRAASVQQSGIPTSAARFAGSSYGQHSEGSLGATWPRSGRGALNQLPLDLPLAGDAPRLSIPPASIVLEHRGKHRHKASRLGP